MSDISVINLKKKFNKKTILNDISFSTNGEFLFLAGRNGAGKTTLINCALELTDIDAGYVKYDTKTLKDVRNQVAVVFDSAKLYLNFTGYTNIKIFNSKNRKDTHYVNEILEALELSHELLQKKVKTYSFGQRHRLAVAIAMINKPQYIFLDEPTIGLDPISWELTQKMLLDSNFAH